MILLMQKGSNIRIFADDTSLFIVFDNPLAAAICLNTELFRLPDGLSPGLKILIQQKNEFLLISR